MPASTNRGRVATPMPRFKSVEAALGKTTELLARELTCPANKPPQWNEFEWYVAQAVAALQGISALLSGALQWSGPEHWRAFLAEQKAHTLLRQQRIEELLSRIDSRMREAGIGVVALKGAALLDMGIYQPGERPMGDVDLLVDSADLNASTRVLTALGHAELFENWRHRVFVLHETQGSVGFGEHIDNPINIELHSRIAERLPIFETDITSLEFPQHRHAGLNPYPSVAALMRHLLLHAAGNMRARALRLIQLHDIALLADRMSSADWQELLDPGTAERGSWWLFPPLALTARYYPAALSATLIDTIAPACPWLLRQVSRHHLLTDVSWSKVRIPAFPGIEWSKSPREALLFAMNRVWPSREALADLSRFTALRPSLADIPWYDLSHGRRILRWVFSRPPRVQTMLSVRSALGHEP